MESVFSNGGVIGATLDYKSTEQYVISETYNRPTLVVNGVFLGGSYSSTNTFTFPSAITTVYAPGDLMIVAFLGSDTNSDYGLAATTAGWTELSDVYANSTSSDVQGALYYKIMGATPDTALVVTSSGTEGSNTVQWGYQIWRGVNQTTPFDVTYSDASYQVINTAGSLPDPAPITPVTTNAAISVIAMAAHQIAGTSSAFTNTSLTGLANGTAGSSFNTTLGMGYYTGWVSGEFNPTAFTGITTASNQSSVAFTLAIRPTLSIVYGNLKNSGIWNLESVFDATTPFYGNTVEYLVIAGGGAAGLNSNDSGGGGAGGYRSSVTGEMSGGGASAESPLTITPGTAYTVTVGAGGASDSNGSNSVFASITSIGGGVGSEGGNSTVAAGNGGSGGGGNNNAAPPGSGTAGQGYAGGTATNGGESAGGGGAGGLGGNSPTGTPAGTSAGGVGVTSSITGTAVGRAGGGGGGNDTAGTGLATDGGGTGGNGNIGTAGTVNTGGGGGGAAGTSGTTAAAGGSGIVIIRYPAAMTTPTISAGLTATTTTVGANKVTVFTAGTGTVTF